MKPPKTTIPHGFCHCGCGQKTRIATKTDRKAKQIRGEPIKFLFAHINRKPRKPIRYGWLEGRKVAYIDCLKEREAIVWATDLPLIRRIRWYCNESGYAVHFDEARRKVISMQSVFIPKVPKGKQRDHINRNRLDNRRSNLRIVLQKHNLWNSGPKRKKKYKGTTRSRYGWTANIRHNYRRIYLGHFKTEELAALAYNQAARKYHGKYAYQNEVSNEKA